MDTVLGRGSYGVAYHATWHEMDVVVKIQTQTLTDARCVHLKRLRFSTLATVS